MRRDAVADLHGLDRDLALHTAVNEPDEALVHVQKAGNLLLRALRCVGGQHLSAVRQRQQREARFGLACEHGGDNRRTRQRVGVRAALFHHAHDAVLEEVARDGQDEETAEHLHARKGFGRELFKRLHAREAREREDRFTPIARHVKLGIARCALFFHALDEPTHECEGQFFLVPDRQRLVADRSGDDALYASKLCTQEGALILSKIRR